MNNALIAIGVFCEDHRDGAYEVADTIGKVEVEMGATSCKVPLATEYIAKIENAGRLGKKRKTIKC